MAVRGRAVAPLTCRNSSTWQYVAEDGRNPKSLNLVSLLRTLGQKVPLSSVFLPSIAIFCRHLPIWLGTTWLRIEFTQEFRNAFFDPP